MENAEVGPKGLAWSVRHQDSREMFEYDIERAQAVYCGIRNHWLAGGSILEAHERLSVITVAAGSRHFAFLSSIEASVRPEVIRLLEAAGVTAGPCSSRFDIELEMDHVSPATVERYRQVIGERDPLCGLGIWRRSAAVSCANMSTLGASLGYPNCCEQMDLETRQKDHALFLEAVVDTEGDIPSRIEEALRARREYAKATEDHCRQWDERFATTRQLFPFVLHTACDECLESGNSPSGVLNSQNEEIAIAVSEELHLMVRWGARVANDYRTDI